MEERPQSPFALIRGGLHAQLHCQVVPDSSGCGVPRTHTPLKRSRADVQQRISGDLARTGCELPVDEVVDHVRSQKRFVSESMAANMSRMAMALGPAPVPGASLRRHSGSSGSLMECLSPPETRTRYQEQVSPAALDCWSPIPTPAPRGRSAEGLDGYSADMMTPQRSLHFQPERTPGLLSPGAFKSRLGRLASSDLAEKLPPSPSDPQSGMDLRKAALLRSLLMRTEEKPANMLRIPSVHEMAEVQAADLPNLQTEEQRRLRIFREPSLTLPRGMSPSDMSLGNSGGSSSSSGGEGGHSAPARWAYSTASSALGRPPSTLFTFSEDEVLQQRGGFTRGGGGSGSDIACRAHTGGDMTPTARAPTDAAVSMWQSPSPSMSMRTPSV